ncbi:hypothetical protein ACIQUY_29295 [Streptomyces sp. NPDC090231]|uniref:hypothetical protein n=1 Tax=unclassified Streptomyces TaxID=2593676 RepID=UPI003804D740
MIEDLLFLTIKLCVPWRVGEPHFSIAISVPPNPLSDALLTDIEQIGDRSMELLQVVEFKSLSPVREHPLPFGLPGRKLPTRLRPVVDHNAAENHCLPEQK